jgi:hypothetical protein
MSEQTKSKVYKAVRRCLDGCFGRSDPLVQATGYISQLRSSPQWSPQETDEVENLVLRAVKVIVRQPRRDCCQGKQ